MPRSRKGSGVSHFVPRAEQQSACELLARDHLVFRLLSELRVVRAHHGSVVEPGGDVADGTQALFGEVRAQSPLFGFCGHEKTDQAAPLEIRASACGPVVHLLNRCKDLAPSALIYTGHAVQNPGDGAGGNADSTANLVESGSCKH